MVAAICALKSDTKRNGGLLPFRALSVLVTDTAMRDSWGQFAPHVSESNTGNRPESRSFRNAFNARSPRSILLCALVPGCG